jgi:sulfatase maturation enzyme AslB (radical SAM superfamily)
MSQKYFPIQTDTSCRLKWSQSSIWLNNGKTGSCCKASIGPIGDNFDNFHNTDLKIKSRRDMLAGIWPQDGCEVCESVESVGGASERMFQNSIPGPYPIELDTLPSTSIDPIALEVFFANTCNLKCVYCDATWSSAIQLENQKFGGAILSQGNFTYADNQYASLVKKFWDWFDRKGHTLKRLQVAGGEPFLQKDVGKLIERFQHSPCPDLEFNIITNLSLPPTTIGDHLVALSNCKNNNYLGRIDIQCSIDSWGVEQEYTRNGINLQTFDTNMQQLIELESFRIGLLSTITSLSLPSMPKLLDKYLEWGQKQTIYWYMHIVNYAEDTVFSPLHFDYSVFEPSINEMLEKLPRQTWDDTATFDLFAGIASRIKNQAHTNIVKQKELLAYLTENDRRRGSNWRKTFPWLLTELEKNHVV